MLAHIGHAELRLGNKAEPAPVVDPFEGKVSCLSCRSVVDVAGRNEVGGWEGLTLDTPAPVWNAATSPGGQGSGTEYDVTGPQPTLNHVDLMDCASGLHDFRLEGPRCGVCGILEDDA